MATSGIEFGFHTLSRVPISCDASRLTPDVHKRVITMKHLFIYNVCKDSAQHEGPEEMGTLHVLPRI